MIGLSAKRSLARQGGNRLSIGMSLHPQDIFDGEHGHREEVEDLELHRIARVELLDRLGGKGDRI
jgi:hypothetical protein